MSLSTLLSLACQSGRCALLALSVLFSFASCSEPATDVVLDLRADPTVQAMATNLQLTVTSESGTPLFSSSYDLTGAQAVQLPVTFTVAAQSSTQTPVIVEFEALMGSTLLVQQRAVVTFASQKSKVLVMSLTASCIDSSCESMSMNALTCSQGMCVNDTVEASTLPDFQSNAQANM